MEFQAITGALTAFMAGLATSPHCVGMCGPIGCAVIPMGKGGTTSTNLGLYHGMRALSYTLLGAIMGALGSTVVDLLQSTPARVLPWIMVAVLVMIGLRLDRFFPKPAAWSRYYHKLTNRMRKMSGASLGAGLGLITPLLPCGPLYLILVLCLFSGSPILGAELALGFALGTIPLLWIGQAAFLHYRKQISPNILRWIQGSIALIAAAVISWRMIASGGEFGEMLCQ